VEVEVIAHETPHAAVVVVVVVMVVVVVAGRECGKV
jgi:hypothetical protein